MEPLTGRDVLFQIRLQILKKQIHSIKTEDRLKTETVFVFLNESFKT